MSSYLPYKQESGQVFQAELDICRDCINTMKDMRKANALPLRCMLVSSKADSCIICATNDSGKARDKFSATCWMQFRLHSNRVDNGAIHFLFSPSEVLDSQDIPYMGIEVTKFQKLTGSEPTNE